MIPESIEHALQRAIEDNYEYALERLAEHDVAIGSIVEVLDFFDKTPTGEWFRVTDIGGWRKDSVYLHGNKLRRDGTYGTHVHSIAEPSRVRVIQGPPPTSVCEGKDDG